jgi:hypothetical protein
MNIWLVEITPKKAHGRQRRCLITRYAVVSGTDAQARESAIKHFNDSRSIESISVARYEAGNVITLEPVWR